MEIKQKLFSNMKASYSELENAKNILMEEKEEIEEQYSKLQN
jgi:hypothetical protein